MVNYVRVCVSVSEWMKADKTIKLSYRLEEKVEEEKGIKDGKTRRRMVMMKEASWEE